MKLLRAVFGRLDPWAALLLGVLLFGCYELELGQTLATWTRIAAPVHHAHAAELPVRAVATP